MVVVVVGAEIIVGVQISMIFKIIIPDISNINWRGERRISWSGLGHWQKYRSWNWGLSLGSVRSWLFR
jgi:hypothetical protein